MPKERDAEGVSVLNGLSRRRYLALAGTGVVGSIAGCTGDEDGSDGADGADGGDSPTDSETAAPTETATATDEPTEAGTQTMSAQERLDHYGCPNTDVDGDYDVVVAQDGSGDYETVQAAIDDLAGNNHEETRVFIEPGEYYEKIRIPSNRMDVTFIGEDPEETVLVYDDHAAMEETSGGGGSVKNSALDFTAKNITFKNPSGLLSQAVALRVSGDRNIYENCRFIGYQDTLYLYGERSRQYYKDCHIEGNTDFIFGGSTAYFENCTIFSVEEDASYITAASTPQNRQFGYVFNNCEITGDASENSCYLGRPWRPHARTVFMNSYIGDHIRPEGWHNWGDPEKEDTAFYAEYNNEGPGYTPDERVEWSHQLSDREASLHEDPVTVLDGWDPTECL